MNGENQPQQEQHLLAARIAHAETALAYQGKAQSDMRDEMRERFNDMRERLNDVRDRFDHVDTELARLRAEIREGFARTDEQMMKVRTTDIRILLGICTTMALGILGLVIKVFGQL